MTLSMLFQIFVITTFSDGVVCSSFYGLDFLSEIESLIDDSSLLNYNSSAESDSDDDISVSSIEQALQHIFKENGNINKVLRMGNPSSDKDERGDINKALRLGRPMSAKEQARLERREKQKNIIEELRRKKLKELHMKRVLEIKNFMLFNFRATEFFYNEIKVILDNREVLGPIRKVVLEAEARGGAMQDALKHCSEDSWKIFEFDQWARKPNKITYHYLDPEVDLMN